MAVENPGTAAENQRLYFVLFCYSCMAFLFDFHVSLEEFVEEFCREDEKKFL
jgi:hypothetical protein